MPCDAYWRRVTKSGNAAFATNDMGTAITQYRAAIAEAEALFELATRCPQHPGFPAAAVINISYHNAADMERRRGQDARATTYLTEAFERLATAAETTTTPAHLRQECARHLKPSLFELCQHLLRLGLSHADIAPHVERAKRAAEKAS